jgi:hypothetical protein
MVPTITHKQPIDPQDIQQACSPFKRSYTNKYGIPMPITITNDIIQKYIQQFTKNLQRALEIYRKTYDSKYDKCQNIEIQYIERKYDDTDVYVVKIVETYTLTAYPNSKLICMDIPIDIRFLHDITIDGYTGSPIMLSFDGSHPIKLDELYKLITPSDRLRPNYTYVDVRRMCKVSVCDDFKDGQTYQVNFHTYHMIGHDTQYDSVADLF